MARTSSRPDSSRTPAAQTASATPTPTPMRERIVGAALEVIRERGIAAMTTKQIARTAQVAEGSIYNHFANKTELVGAAMAGASTGIRAAMTELFADAGGRGTEEKLARFAEAAVGFFLDLLPIAGPVLGDREQLGWMREAAASSGFPVGPLPGQQALSGWLAAEQGAGRLGTATPPELLASLLLGMCQNYAFLTLLSGADAVATQTGLPADHAVQARAVARTVLTAAGNSTGNSDGISDEKSRAAGHR